MKVSVVTVNLNGNRYLTETLDSVLAQDHRDLEAIVVDGGSTDGSLETIRAFASRDSRVTWRSEPDLGIADAMNKGVAMAGGELAAFLHSDDFYPERDVLSAVVEAVAGRPETIWLTGGMLQVDSHGRELRRFAVRNYSYRWLQRSNILFHPATFVRTRVLRVNRFDPELQLAMDYDLWLRLGAMADPLLLSRPLAAFRVHSGSISSCGASAALAEEYAVRRRFLKVRGLWRCWYPLDYFAKRLVVGRPFGH